MSQRYRGAALALALAGGLGASGGASAQQIEVVFALPAVNLGFAPVFIAEGQGYWKEAGLDVRLPVISGVGAINSVLAKSADFAIATAQTVIRANVRGQKPVVLASFFNNLAHELLIAKAQADAAGIALDSPFGKRAQAIKGKKIAVNATNAIPHGYLRMFARKGGLDPERDVTVAVMSPEASFAALKTGAIDGLVQALPYTLVPLRQGTGTLISSNLRANPDFPDIVPQVFNGVVTRAGLCEEKREVCRRMVAGFVRALAFMHDHPRESVEILGRRIPGEDRSILEEAYRLMIPWTPRTGAMTEQGWGKAQDLLLATGMMKAEEKLASFSHLYTNAFLQ